MPEVLVRRDNLDAENARFVQHPLRQGVFLNSVPKSGSHLQQHRAAFDPAHPRLSWGHLLYADASAIETAPARRVLLYRDPYDWVIARARFMLSEQFRGNVDHLRSGALNADELLTLMIFGLPGNLPSLNAIYELNAVAWLGSRCHVIRMEDLAHHVATLDEAAAEGFFAALLDACGIAAPADWRERVRAGADRRESATARENLTGIELELPRVLGQRHRDLVDYQAPGLRRILGYA